MWYNLIFFLAITNIIFLLQKIHFRYNLDNCLFCANFNRSVPHCSSLFHNLWNRSTPININKYRDLFHCSIIFLKLITSQIFLLQKIFFFKNIFVQQIKSKKLWNSGTRRIFENLSCRNILKDNI